MVRSVLPSRLLRVVHLGGAEWSFTGAGRGCRALVTVLWVLMLLSLVAASFMATTRTEVNLTRNQIENARAEAVTEIGAVFVREAVVGLTGDSDRPFEFYAWRQGKRAAAGNGQAD